MIDTGWVTSHTISSQYTHMSHEQWRTLIVWWKQGILLPNYIGMLIRHYKDLYETTRIQWKVRVGFSFFVAHGDQIFEAWNGAMTCCTRAEAWRTTLQMWLDVGKQKERDQQISHVMLRDETLHVYGYIWGIFPNIWWSLKGTDFGEDQMLMQIYGNFEGVVP